MVISQKRKGENKMNKNDIIIAKLELVLAELKGESTTDITEYLDKISKVDIFTTSPKEIREVTKAVKISDKIVKSIENLLKA